MSVDFTTEMYEAGRAGSISSAEVIVPLALECARYPVKSAIDVGCGEGWFAREFATRAVPTIGYDVTVEPGVRDGVTFEQRDLTAADLSLAKADMACCLEVAEHLPESAADGLIEALTTAAPYVLFSAAIPGQGGNGHINCQWPAYWVEKFHRCGFDVSGSLRWFLWDDERVEPWYRQNLLIAMQNTNLHEVEKPPHKIYSTFGFMYARSPYTRLCVAADGFDVPEVLLHEPYPVVHPSIWNAWVQP